MDCRDHGPSPTRPTIQDGLPILLFQLASKNGNLLQERHFVLTANTMGGHPTGIGFGPTDECLLPFFLAPCTEDFHNVDSSMLMNRPALPREVGASLMPPRNHNNKGLIEYLSVCYATDMQFRRERATFKQKNRAHVRL